MAKDKDLDLAAAMADTSKLEPFEGREVVRSIVAIKGAGDGLSKALAVAPVAYHQGEEVFVLLKCVVGPVGFPALSKDTPDILARKHDFVAQTATVVSSTIAKSHIEAQEKIIAAAKDKARGQERLVGADGDDTKVNPKAAADGASVLEFKGGKKAAAAATKEAHDALRQLSKDNLRALCDRHGITYAARATGEKLVELLVDVPGIAAEAVVIHGTP